jgi:hypothetical protein
MLYIDKMKLGKEEELSEEVLYSIGRAISSVWIVSVSVFFMTCEIEYIRTFFGTATAKTYAYEVWCWQMSQQNPKVTDEAIVKVFSKHRDVYKHFEGEVSVFVSLNWERWTQEKPRFFTAKFNCQRSI